MLFGVMGMNSGTVDAFLRERGFHADLFDFDEEVARFIVEMERGLRGEDSSLRMYPAYLDASVKLPENGGVIAVDAGGTNLRVALIKFKPDQAIPDMLGKEVTPVPGSRCPVSIEQFFDKLVELMLPILDQSDKVGVCFSFPSEIMPSLDARIVVFDKELCVVGSEGASIAKSLNEALERVGAASKKVTVINDTVAALLGELAVQPARERSGFVGIIHGTGFNICYNERVENIEKLGDTAPAGLKNMLINTEAGGYAGFKQGVCDVELDKESQDPGAQRFEKMISGAYLGPLALRVLKLAAADGLFGEKATGIIQSMGSIAAPNLTDFMHKSIGEESFETEGENPLDPLYECGDDCLLAREILDGLYIRAAKLFAISVTAIMKRSRDASENAPTFLTCEGSSFKKGYKFRERFSEFMQEFAPQIKYELAITETHTLLGAATAASL